MSSKRVPISDADDLDTLSAIWILSCNDDNAIMTYQSIVQRLSLPPGFDVKGLVRSRSELFRPGILKSILEAWKDEMRSGKSRPGWLVEIRDHKAQETAINGLTRDDIFRNQFRVERHAPKCTVEIIEWGLRHIERLRKDRVDEGEGKFRRISMVWIPLLSLLLAASSVVVSSVTQWKSIRSQEKLKFYEVDFKPKLDSYAAFMDEMMLASLAADKGLQDEARVHIERMESSFYRFEPFLTDAQRVAVFQKLSAFIAACSRLIKTQPDSRKEALIAFTNEVAEDAGYFRTTLYKALFAAAGRSPDLEM